MACRQWMQADAIRFLVTGRGAQGLLARAAGQGIRLRGVRCEAQGMPLRFPGVIGRASRLWRQPAAGSFHLWGGADPAGALKGLRGAPASWPGRWFS